VFWQVLMNQQQHHLNCLLAWLTVSMLHNMYDALLHDACKSTLDWFLPKK